MSRDESLMEHVGSDVPAWLQEISADDTTLDALREYRVLNRLAVIQQMSDIPLKEKYGEGSIVLFPTGFKISSVGNEAEGVVVAPLYFWAEFLVRNDRRDKNNPAVAERTLDPLSDIAKRARDKERREEEYEGGPSGKPFRRKFIERLNFAVLIKSGQQAGDIVGLAFERGEFWNGKNFCTGVVGRKVALWAQQWRLTSSLRPENKDGNQWYGFDFEFAGFCEQEDAEALEKMHLELKDDHQKRKLGVEEDPEADAEDVPKDEF